MKIHTMKLILGILAVLTIITESIVQSESNPQGKRAAKPLFRDPVHDGAYHMYLTLVPGTFENWSHPRDIIHLTSKDLLKWKYESTLKLSSNKSIDACVIQLPNGTWRMPPKNGK